MRCADVIANVKALSNAEIDNHVGREILAHLRNCKYCRNDSETILKVNEAGNANDSDISPQILRKVHAVIIDSKPIPMPERIFSLIEVKPVWVGCADELRNTFREFVEDPKKFVVSLFRGDALQVDQSEYWRVGITRLILVWFFTGLFSVSLYYSGYGHGHVIGKGGRLEKIADLTPLEAPRWLKLPYPRKHTENRLPNSKVQPITAALLPPQPALPINPPKIERSAVELLSAGPLKSDPTTESKKFKPTNHQALVITLSGNRQVAINEPLTISPASGAQPVGRFAIPFAFQSSGVPVNVLIRVLNPLLKVGQGGLMGVILKSSGVSLTGTDLVLRYDPKVIKITAVRDGGLLSLQGAQAELTHTDSEGLVQININRPQGAQPVQVSGYGQLALIYYQGVGKGSTDLNISEIELRGPNGSIPVTVVNGNVEVQQLVGIDDDDDDE